MPSVSPDEVLQYWFGTPARDEPELMAKIRRWFQGGEAVDREITERFGPSIEAAMAGELDSWAASPRTRLALVLLLDQFTRNVFRGTPRMYEADPRAQKLALGSFDDGSAGELSLVEQLFLSMPLLHSENVELHRRQGKIVAGLAATAPELYRMMFAMGLEQSAKYLDIIERFGRFPHRNTILGRTSTPDEIEFLVDWDEKARPSAARS